MQQQITRDNHYVPQWYQRGFLPKGQHKLHVLNLQPADEALPGGRTQMEAVLEELGPKLAFKERDLYTTRFGQTLNDEIETFLFGKIDKNGADAVRAWIAGDQLRIHRLFLNFFEYLDAQKLRTPKGLDWIQERYRGLSQLELMLQMQSLRKMHATMWSECVREIVSAAKSPVKFLVSDHPVTIYHPQLQPNSGECTYPRDPGIELIGSQTVFALDADHCLILTNLEYAENPKNADVLSRRTNARFRGNSMARTDAFIRGREFSEDEVNAVNLVLKSRAKKYVGASNRLWLHPEQHCKLAWAHIAPILLPQKDLWRFGGEIYIGHEDGTSSYRDKFGRTSKAHEILAKAPTDDGLDAGAPCGCGSGLSFQECCADLEPHRRPSWNVLSIRERNLILINGIADILKLNEANTWLEVRRGITDDQVREIHELFATLWPTDTQLVELLPRPQGRRSRALYLGIVDARTLSTSVTGMLPYVDELILVHPFVNANGVRPEYSPVQKPAQFREQTLRNVLVLMQLETAIRAGRVHLVPDSLDYDAGFRHEIMTITKREDVERTALGPMDQALSRELSRDEMMRAIKRLPFDSLKAYITRQLGHESKQFTADDIGALVQRWKQELEDDPLACLDPPPANDGEFKILKGFSRETGLYVATLTGSFVYTSSDTQWDRLHQADGVHTCEPDPRANEAIFQLAGATLEMPAVGYELPVDPVNAKSIRELLRTVTSALRSGGQLDVSAPSFVETEHRPSPKDDAPLPFKLRASVPLGGFQRTDVSRLVVTFGHTADAPPVQFALLLEPRLGSHPAAQ